MVLLEVITLKALAEMRLVFCLCESFYRISPVIDEKEKKQPFFVKQRNRKREKINDDGKPNKKLRR